MSEPSKLEMIQKDLVAAMKAKDAEQLSTLRMLKSALMEAKTKKAKDETLDAEEETEILQRYVKKRRESIDAMKQAGRDDMVAKEEQEIAVTRRYLPEEMGEDQVRAIVTDAVTKTGATSPKEMGKVMGMVMPQVKGRADGTLVSRLVKEALTGGSES